MGKSFWGIYSIGVTTFVGILMVRGGLMGSPQPATAVELEALQLGLKRLASIEAELKDVKVKADAMSIELQLARQSVRKAEDQSANALEVVERGATDGDSAPQAGAVVSYDLGATPVADTTLVPAPRHVATSGLIRAEPTYISLSTTADVEVLQGSNGSIFVKNSDPDLAFETIEVEATRDDGTIEMLSLTVPPPAVD
jgi:hypothetical protein